MLEELLIPLEKQSFTHTAQTLYHTCDQSYIIHSYRTMLLNPVKSTKLLLNSAHIIAEFVCPARREIQITHRKHEKSIMNYAP